MIIEKLNKLIYIKKIVEKSLKNTRHYKRITFISDNRIEYITNITGREDKLYKINNVWKISGYTGHWRDSYLYKLEEEICFNLNKFEKWYKGNK